MLGPGPVPHAAAMSVAASQARPLRDEREESACFVIERGRYHVHATHTAGLWSITGGEMADRLRHLRHLRRAGLGLAAAVLGWLLLLTLAGTCGEDYLRRRAERSLAEALQGTATIGELDVAFVRGRARAADVHVRREHQGILELRVQTVEAEFAPLGAAALTQRLHRLAVRDVTVNATSRAVLGGDGRVEHPLVADEVVVERARLQLAAGALLPAAIDVDVARARTGPTRFTTTLSWLFALRELDAAIDAPGGKITATLRGPSLTLVGGLAGATPIDVDVGAQLRADGLPTDPAARREAELDRLIDVAATVGREVALARARQWLDAP